MENAKDPFGRVFLIVLDSLGCGAAPDADKYGDGGADTVGHIAAAVDGPNLPHLQFLGLGNLTHVPGVPPRPDTLGGFGRMAEASPGKDTTTGHWEIAGLKLDKAFPVFEGGFPPEILDPFKERTGRGVLGNTAASGTEILKELGPQHMETGDLIVYTSADSVFQIAAHEEVVPLDELYSACKIAREILDPYNVGRVIARPFVGSSPSDFKRTYNRKDFSVEPPANTVLEALTAADVPVVGIGKIGDIYAHRGVTQEIHTEGNSDGMAKILEAKKAVRRGLVFTNLVDFDMLFGHRNNARGYYSALKKFDEWLPELQKDLEVDDLVILTADHGNDPTTPGTDHTREYVPLLVFGPAVKKGVDLGTRESFADIGATLADNFGIAAPPSGKSFLSEIRQ